MERLRVIGLVCMMVDHVGAVFFPGCLWMREIGRLAVPVFGWLIVVGLRRTMDEEAYILRLVGVGLLSQAGYGFFFGGVNDLLCLSLGACIVCAGRVDDALYWFGGVLAVVDPSKWHVILTVPVMELSGDVLQRCVLLGLVNVGSAGLLNLPAALGGLGSVEVVGRGGARLPRWCSYGVYPAHFWVLKWVKYWIPGVC